MIVLSEKRGRSNYITKKFTNPRAAFTLVELLVVIGIIAILVGILLPALNKARASAQEVQSASNMRQFGMGFQIYADANKGFLPEDGPDGHNTPNFIGRTGPNVPAYDANGNYVPTGFDDPALWYNAVPPLVNNRAYFDMVADYLYNGKPFNLPGAGANNIWVCPSASSPASLAGPGGYAGSTPEIFVPNTNSVTSGAGDYFGLWGRDSYKTAGGRPSYTPIVYPVYMCYVLNSKLFTSLATTPVTYITHVKLAQLRPGSDVVLMTEKIMNYGEYSQSSDPEVFAYWATTQNATTPGVTAAGFTKNLAQPKATNTRFTTRHRHGGNLLFADGHVSWFAWTQVQGIPDKVSGQVQTINRPDNHVIWCPYGAVQNGSGAAGD